MGPAALLNIVVNAQTGQATAALTKTQAQLKGTAATAETSSARIGKAATAASARLAALARTGALAGGVVAAASTKMAFDFEESMMKVRNLVGASEKQVDEWGDALLKMAGKVGKSPQELADTLYFVSSAGIKTSKVLNTVKIAAEASALGLGDAATIADSLTSAMNAYAKSGLSAKDATNVLVKTVKFGKLEADSLAQSIGRVIPVASKLKVPFEDVGASLAAMSLQGLDAAESTTALRAIFTSMIKPTDASEKALSSVGLSAESLRDSLEQDGTLATLQMLSDKLGGNVEAIGEVFPNVRALVGAFNLTGDSAKQNALIYDELGSKTDDLGKGFERLSGTPTQRMRAAIASIQAVMTNFGSKVLPIAADALKDFADILSDKKLTSDEKITAMVAKLGDKLANVVAEWAPKVAEAGAKVGLALAQGLSRAFFNADIEGKLSMLAIALGASMGAGIKTGLKRTGIGLVIVGALEAVNRISGNYGEVVAAEWASGFGAKLESAIARKSVPALKRLITIAEHTTMVLNELGWGGAAEEVAEEAERSSERARRALDRLMDKSREADDRTGKSFSRVGDHSGRMAERVVGNAANMVNGVGEGLQTLGSNTNKALQAFGAKKVGFSIEKAAKTIGSFAGKQKGGSVVPGSGSGDKVFSGAWTEPNEGLFVLNRNAMGAYQHFNDLFPRFPGRQAGGWVDPAGPGTGVVNPAIAGVVGKWSQRYDAAINYGFDPGGGHVSPGHNVTGTATDTGPAAGWLAGPTALFERGLRSLVSSGLQVLYGTGGIGTPFPNHGRGNHAHIEWGSNPGAIGMAEQIARMVLNGPDGPLKSMGQGALDKPWRAAKAMLLKQMTVTGGGDRGSFGAAGTLGKSQLTSLWSGANSFGNPNLMAAIALAESGGNPAAHGPPDGRGLWQIEWPIWGSTLGHFGNPYSPMPNAKMAGEILKQQGLGAWVVYNTGAHQQFLQKGGEIPSFHDGGIFRSKRPGGEGLAMLRDREIVSTQHDIGHLRKRLRDDDLDNKDRRRLERQVELLQTLVEQQRELIHENRAMRRQGEQTNRLNRQEVARFLSEELGAGLGQAGSRRALGTAGAGSVGTF